MDDQARVQELIQNSNRCIFFWNSNKIHKDIHCNRSNPIYNVYSTTFYNIIKYL